MNSIVGDRYIAELVQIFEQQGQFSTHARTGHTELWERKTIGWCILMFCTAWKECSGMVGYTIKVSLKHHEGMCVKSRPDHLCIILVYNLM